MPDKEPWDLRRYVQEMTKAGELKVVENADWNLEIGALTDLNAKKRGPALLFDEIKDYPKGYRVLSCMLSGPKRLSYVLGFEPTSDHGKLVSQLQGKPGLWEEHSKDFAPKVVNDSPLMKNAYTDSSKIDLFKFPSPKWHEADGGRYIGTGGAVITRDPETGVINAGTYRMMVHEKDVVALQIQKYHHGSVNIAKYHSKGEPCPVVLSFGHDPLLYVAACLPIPYGISEFNYAGAVRKEPVEVLEGKVTGLPIPASSEIAAEGFIYPNDLVEEGPFGEFTGYYAGERALRPAVRLKALYHRDDPIILGSLPGKPPFDHSYWRTVVESALVKDKLQKTGIPGVLGVWKHEASCSYFWTVVSIRQQYPGHAKQAGVVAAQCMPGYGRYVIVVDDDIDPSDLQEVIWAISTRSDPASGIDIIHNATTGSLDPMVKKPASVYTSSRAVIVACRPFEWKDKFPRVVEVSNELKSKIASKWPDLV
ncbi:MAG: UbiD family decarboxylase [Nitrososphaerota archaeon]|nr:UbiD family decarboxylase [Nitrososphaerota archaeon]